MNMDNMTLAGQISRTVETKVDQRMIKTGATLAYGQAVMLDGDGISPCLTSETFFGILARSTNEDLTGAQAVVTRGFITVKATGTPVAGAPVFLRIANSGTKKIGDIETVLVAGETVALTRCKFATSGKNANNLAEMEVY